MFISWWLILCMNGGVVQMAYLAPPSSLLVAYLGAEIYCGPLILHSQTSIAFSGLPAYLGDPNILAGGLSCLI